MLWGGRMLLQACGASRAGCAMRAGGRGAASHTRLTCVGLPTLSRWLCQVGNASTVLGFVGAPFTLATYIVEGAWVGAWASDVAAAHACVAAHAAAARARRRIGDGVNVQAAAGIHPKNCEVRPLLTVDCRRHVQEPHADQAAAAHRPHRGPTHSLLCALKWLSTNRG